MLITAEIDLAAIDHNVRQLRGITDRRAVSPEQNHRRSSVAGDIGAGRINHVG